MNQMIKGIIFDIDGVLEYRGKVYSHAVDTIQRLRNRGLVVRFLTNSTLKSRASCARILREKGFTVFDDEVFTASYITAIYLKLLHPRSCWIMLEGEGRDEFKDFRQDYENPEYIVIGDNRSCFNFDHLNKALRLLLNGARLIGMQSELIDTSMGKAELNVGSWVGMLERASGVQAIYMGKPNSFAFELALQSMVLGNTQVAMIGDRLAADVMGASKIGMQTVLVTTGEFRPSDLTNDVHPDFIVNSIRDIPDILLGL
jgi:HAD superfamily hydrolase (TIGR01458 family)